jgi:hypothetical protein
MESRKSKLSSRRGFYIRLDNDLKSKIAVIRGKLAEVLEETNMPQTIQEAASDEAVVLDLIKRGYEAYKEDKNRLH